MPRSPTSIPPKGQTTAQSASITSQALSAVKSSDLLSKALTGVDDLSLPQPRGNRVLIRRIEEPSEITLTDAPKSIKGVILSCGPGKWIPGEWWKVNFNPFRWPVVPENTIENEHGFWEWFPGHRKRMDVKPGMTVLFNSKWNDLSHAENKGTGADGAGPLERPLSYKLDPLTHLVTEDDIFCILPDASVKASLGKPTLEREYFVNRAVSGPWSEA